MLLAVVVELVGAVEIELVARRVALVGADLEIEADAAVAGDADMVMGAEMPELPLGDPAVAGHALGEELELGSRLIDEVHPARPGRRRRQDHKGGQHRRQHHRFAHGNTLSSSKP